MGVHVVIHGRLGRDPETRSIASGDSVTKLNVAADRGYGDKKTTTWVSVDVWGRRGETVAKHLKKGSEVVVRGELYTREYEAKDGSKRTSIECRADEVSFAGSGKGNANANTSGGGSYDDAPAGSGNVGGGTDDDIPF